MVLLLILVFGDTDLPLVAAVWAMMAFGDPAAAIAGRLVGGPALPWNRRQDLGRLARELGRRVRRPRSPCSRSSSARAPAPGRPSWS